MNEIHRITSSGAYEIPESLYHGQPCDGPSISSTGIKRLAENGAAEFFRTWSGNPNAEPEPPKAAFDIGRAAHIMALEPGRVANTIAVYPDEVLASNGAVSTKAAKEFEAKARAEGRTPIKPGDWQMLNEMRSALERHPHARRFLEAGRAEVSVFARRRDFWIKARPDFLPERSGQYLVDLKTTTSLKDFYDNGIKKLRYDIQAALYLRAVHEATGIRPAGMLFFAQEKKPPYRVGLMALSVGPPGSTDILRAAELDIHLALEAFERGLETSHWPDPFDEPRELGVPGWLRGQIEKRLESESNGTEFAYA
ncbi:MAG: PD-(D/E)XK nuclease-like domain-containing protein [Pseudomonadota bacterium]